MDSVIIDDSESNAAYTADSELIKVVSTGIVYSTNSTPALTSSNFTDLYVVNFGIIANTSTGAGLLFTKSSTVHDEILNKNGALISGHEGVLLESTGVTIFNDTRATIIGTGTHSGNAGLYLSSTSAGDSIDNVGAILGKMDGVFNHSQASGLGAANGILNQGTIAGGHVGIGYSTPAGSSFTIENWGMIKGGIAAVATSGTGAIDLVNYVGATLKGGLWLESSNSLDGDSIRNEGTITGAVKLGYGADVYYNLGSVTGIVFGEAGNDQLTGGRGTDQLNGGAGRDLIDGGGGIDTLTGGPGSDHFIFDTSLANSVSHIADFAPGVDKIELSNLIFGAVKPAFGSLSASTFHVGPGFTSSAQRIHYNPANGWLVYDSNGSATGGNHHHFATLALNLGLHASDFMLG